VTIAIPGPAAAALPVPLLALVPGIPRAADPYQVYLDQLGSAESRRTMQGCLDRIARMITEGGEPLPPDYPPVTGRGRAWWMLRYEHTAHIRAKLLERGQSPSHVNKHMSALRGVLGECWNLELMSTDDYHRAVRAKNVKGTREKAGRSIHDDEMRTLLAACIAAEGPIGVRDAALVAVLQSTGVRREEAATALIEHYDPGERSLRIIGKGNKERTVYIHPDAVPHLERWLAVLGVRRGPLFRPVGRYGKVGTARMTSVAIGRIVDRRRRQAAMQPLSAHDFRRTFAGEMIDHGADLPQVQRALGHAHVDTTAGYDRRPGRQLRDAVDRLHLPRPEEFSGGS
jgi:integrase